MPSRRCQHPTCTRYVAANAGCPDHPRAARQARAGRDAFYDQHRRDPSAKAFYNSAEWKGARADVLADRPVCQRCGRAFAGHVHHVVPLARCTPAQRTARDNLLAVCPPCHNGIEAEARAAR